MPKPQRNISFKIDDELHQEFRLYCLNRRQTMKQVMLDFIHSKVTTKKKR